MSDRELSSNEIQKAFEASAAESLDRRADREDAKSARRQNIARRTKQTLSTVSAIGVLGLAGAVDRDSAAQSERDVEAAKERLAQPEGELAENVEVHWPNEGPENR